MKVFQRGKRIRSLAGLLIAVLVFGSLSGCSGPGRTVTVKIGAVTPMTGALAGNGEGFDWSVEQIYDYVRENPIIIGGREAKLEIIVYDSQSDIEKCRELAERMAVDDKVDLMLAAQTPETVIPVAEIAEEYGIPCIGIQAPVDPVAHARETYDWTYHSFWTIDDVYGIYQSLWTTAGFPKDSGAKVGLLFANDSDGSAWHDTFLTRMQEDGYVPVDPGQYPLGNQDFSDVAETFYREKVDIITGTNEPPDYMNAMNTFLERGVEAECVTMGKCCILETDAAAMGELSIGLLSEVLWTPSDNIVSDLTGMSAKELNERYFEENFGRDMSPPAAFGYAGLELAVHALQDAGSTNKKAIRKAISELDVETVVGPIRYDKVMGGLHYGDVLLGGGQWQLDNGVMKLQVIDNTVYPEMQITGEYIPGNVLKEK